jgi:hypothetical protein
MSAQAENSETERRGGRVASGKKFTNLPFSFLDCTKFTILPRHYHKTQAFTKMVRYLRKCRIYDITAKISTINNFPVTGSDAPTGAKK